ncbi:MAG: DUF2163 domain-containing protein [Pseudomonadota bacterium]
MKTLSPELQAHLDTGATTLAWCWRVIRADGAILGFTDHDRDLQFDGTMFEANAGLTSSEITESLGLSVDNLEIRWRDLVRYAGGGRSCSRPLR